MENNTCQHRRWHTHSARRKRCVQCGKTKTIREKRRGRKPKRVSIEPLIKHLRGKSIRTSSRDLRRARDLFIRTTPWPDVSNIASSCFLLADALHIRTPTYQLSVYITLVVVIGENRAWILPVYFGKGGESFENWHNSLKQAVPSELMLHVKALVCDGRTSLVSLGKSYGWLIQRCQFHLLARLQSLRSVGSQSRHQEEGMALKAYIKTVFDTKSQQQVLSTIKELEDIAMSETNTRLKTTLSGLVKNHEHYRTYLTSPELKLSHTTNIVESINSLIRGLMRKMRGFENEDSAKAWVVALLKERRYMNIKSHRKSV